MPLLSFFSISCFSPSKSNHTIYKLVIEMIQYTSCFSKINCSIVQYMYNHCLIYGQSLPSPASPRQIPSRAQRRAVLQSHDAAAAITRRGGCNHTTRRLQSRTFSGRPEKRWNSNLPYFYIVKIWLLQNIFAYNSLIFARFHLFSRQFSQTVFSHLLKPLAHKGWQYHM